VTCNHNPTVTAGSPGRQDVVVQESRRII
jgi:hypothetical protein